MILEVLAVSAPKSHPHPPISADIQDETHLKSQWQFTKDHSMKPKVNCLQKSVTDHLNDWWNNMLETLNSEDQSWCKMTSHVMTVPILPTSPGHAGWGFSFLDSGKADVTADCLEAQFQPVDGPMEPAVIWMVDLALFA
jgi:hypothetical protein